MAGTGTTVHLQWPDTMQMGTSQTCQKQWMGGKESGNQCKARDFLMARYEVQFKCTAEITVRKETSWWQVTLHGTFTCHCILYWNALQGSLQWQFKYSRTREISTTSRVGHADLRLCSKAGCKEHKGANGKAEKMVLRLGPRVYTKRNAQEFLLTVAGSNSLICLIKTDKHTYIKLRHLPNLHCGTNEV